MLSQQLREYVSACFTGLWVQSFEHDDALAEIAQLCRQENWRLASWDVDQGLRMLGVNDQAAEAGTSDPLAAIRSLGTLAEPGGCALLVLPNFHRFLNSTEIIQAIAHQITAGKQSRTFLVVLSPVVQIPVELEKHFVVIEHELPGRQQLEEIARGIGTEEGEMPRSGRIE